MIRRWIFLRDGRLSPASKIALALVFAVALLATLPMRLALAWAAPGQVTAREVEGTVWAGALYDLRIGALPLGDVNAHLRPLPLLLARAELHIDRPGAAAEPALRANVAGGSGWAYLHEVSGQVPLGDAFGALPATALGFRDFHLDMAGGSCREAGGQVSLILSPLSELMPGTIALTGAARCAKGALYVPMTGPSGFERVFLRLEPDGRWRADLVLAGLPVEVTTPLLNLGFSARPGGIGLSARGRL